MCTTGRTVLESMGLKWVLLEVSESLAGLGVPEIFVWFTDFSI
jgi:hypothetical protein